MTFPVLGALIALPALGAIAVSQIRDARRARPVALGVAIATLALSTVIALALSRSTSFSLAEISPAIPGLGARWHVGVDGLSAPFLPLASLLATAVIVAAPHEELGKTGLVAVLLSLATTLGVYCSLDLLLLTTFWIVSLVPGAMQMHRARSEEVRRRLARTYDVFLVLGSLPIVAATLVIAWSRTRAGVELPFDLANTATAPVPLAEQQVVFVLLALALLIRKAIFPFHSWLPVLVERGPIGIATMVVGTHLGAFLIARVVIPILPSAARSDLPILADVALFSALYAAFVALGQRDLRRTLGFILTSQLGLVLVGLAEVGTDSIHGAMLQMLALGLTSSGLLLVAAAIEARTGTTEIARLGGLVQRFPTMAAVFFLLGLATIGLPGTLQYVAEDLLLHGLLDAHPIVATILLIVTVLNGVTLLRLFFAMFLGPSREPRLIGPGVKDLVGREAAVIFALIALVVAGGFVPSPLLAVRRECVRALAIADAPSEHQESEVRAP